MEVALAASAAERSGGTEFNVAIWICPAVIVCTRGTLCRIMWMLKMIVIYNELYLGRDCGPGALLCNASLSRPDAMENKRTDDCNTSFY